MTDEQILQAFNGRWRIKKETLPLDSLKYEGIAERVKSLCLDFFRTGILLASDTVTSSTAEEQTPTIPMSVIVDADVEANGFDFFWSLYDKKVGKPKAQKLWAKLSLDERKACLAYIPLYKQAQPDKQFRKNPETFLRNHSWNDELIYRNNAADNKPSIQQQRIDKLATILTD